VRKKSRRNKASRDTSPPESLSKAPPTVEHEGAPSSRALRDSQPDSPAPRISLIASEPEPPLVRPKSEPPAPLRTSGSAVTPPAPPASAPLRAAPPVSPATPLRTPVTISDREATPPSGGGRDSQGEG
jgi:hypothetical protein